MAPTPSSSGATTSVQVALRIRPPTNQDASSIPARFQRTVINAISATSVSIDNTSNVPASIGSAAAVTSTASSAGSNKKQVFTFDQVHPPSSTQHDIFTSTAQPLISRFVEGFNCTILAYGQTSSGKTFTMTGIDLDADPSDPSNGMGIIPRAVATIFSRCKELKEERGNTWNYSIKGSFIEIYNEDLIDLLSMDEGGGRREVQIREDKQGHIIWEGLREVSVRSASEVQNLIRQGTAIRRTNETDMNAQSSRSHAIFSLTLIQKKFSGSGVPPRSTSPLPPGGRSPSRIARPGSSVYAAGARVSSPTFGRPPTPSFHTAIGRGGARPASSLGLLAPDGGRGHNAANGDDERGEWTTVVSKFHFVDLAGSERLKRTAAAGERIKEGISINSGLLALGNVISALGDPARAKSHTATYIPYRDSKLTRLLQDSLGGNAHTLMIACVSPAEWNAAETVNTLKYANRARNIKNRVVVNEKEEGWDDVEWLQGMVTRLRKELKGIKEGGGGAISSTKGAEVSTEVVESKKVLAQMAQMTELQNNYEDLREKFSERTEELTRLRQELSVQQRSKGGHIGGTAKYEEIVGPVIEEYEKTINAMEAELKLNRAALRHTNDLYEEKENELTELSERHATTEMYVEELRSRVVKLTEREASTEAYIRDLEEKVKLYDESSISSSGSISDLKRELTKYRDNDSYNSQYITDLEARLARSDESVLALRATVEKLEQEAQRRRNEAEALQLRLESLTQDGQNWRNDLEERERKVRALELKMEEWETKRKEAGEQRERLGDLVDEVAKARKNLEAGVASKVNESSQTPSEVSSIHEADDSLESQLVALQQTHTATLADLSSVSAKYRDALREIADLAAQLQEAKVNAPTPLSELSESPERPSGEGLPISPRRRPSRGFSNGPDLPINGSGRRLFFRQAASAESLHARSLSQSLSLSQELSSARSRQTSISSHGTNSPVSHSPSHSQTHSRANLSLSLATALNVNPNERSVQSLEQEIMRLQEVLKERETEITSLETSLRESERRGREPINTPTTGSPVAPSTPQHERADSLLDHLSPKTMSQFQALRQSLDLSSVQNGNDTAEEQEGSLDRLNELMRSMAQKESSHREELDALNDELSQVRRQYDELTVLSRDQTLNMANELEGLHSQHAETLAQLEQAKIRESELRDSISKAQAEHAAVLDDLKAQHAEALSAKEKEVDDLLLRLKSEHESGVAALREELDASQKSELARLGDEHSDTVRSLQEQLASGEAALARTKEEHEAIIQTLREQLADASATLAKAHQDHTEAFGKLKADHEEELRLRAEEAATLLDRTQKDHTDLLDKAKSEYDALIRQKEEAATANLQHTEEEYYDALTKLRGDHAVALEKQTAEAATALERLKDEHTREMRMAEIAREGSLTESQSSRDIAIKELQEEHSSAIAKKESLFAEDIQRLKDEHAQAITAKDEQHRNSVQRLKSDHKSVLHDKEAAFEETLEKMVSEHERALSTKEREHATALEKLAAQHTAEVKRLVDESNAEMEKLKTELGLSKESLVAAAATHAHELDEAIRLEQEKHAMILQEIERGHTQEVNKLKELHIAALASSGEDAEGMKASLLRSHAEETSKLRAQHQQAIAALESDLIAAQEDHRKDLENSRAQAEQFLNEEKARLSTVIAELEERHTAEKATLTKDHELLLEEVEAYKAAADEFVQDREAMRDAHQEASMKQSDTTAALKTELSGANNDKEALRSEVEKLRAELDATKSRTTELVREASKRESLVDELEKHRSVLADLQETLQKTKDEMDTLQAEKSRQDSVLRDLQAQLSRSPSPGSRPAGERGMSFSRVNGISPAKLPPLTPPPAGPPPPTPRSMHEAHAHAGSTTSTIMSTSSRSIDSPVDSPSTPATSVTHSFTNGALATPSAVPAVSDLKLMAQVQEQTKRLEEQETMIKTLNKQLTHCESDLQAHMDMVATLETSLAESEKNLRKARMQATELSRERDNLNNQLTSLRTELSEAKNEVASVRRSIVEEKQSLESRLDEERRAKERARAQLDSRMDELQRRKSKFACL
ncbi:TRAFAC class myosin-kinesin ATPase superfamily protein [Abortiporus biennis]